VERDIRDEQLTTIHIYYYMPDYNSLLQEFKYAVERDIRDEQLTTIHIYYYMPDYNSLLQEFSWQTIDYDPEFPRTHRFLDHWKSNVEARIQAIYLMHANYWGQMRKINFTHRFEQ